MKPLKLGTFPLAGVVARIGAFAEAYKKAGRERRYVLSGDRLVLEERLTADSALLMRTLNRHGRMIKVDLPLTAQVVAAGWNVRILGLGGDARLTAQIRMQSGKGELLRELTARRAFEKIVAADPEVSLPAIRAYDQKHGLWLVEDLVDGRRANLAELASFLSTAAPRLYESTARLRPIGRDVHRCRPLISELAQSAPRLATLADVPDDARWPVALCHGDLTVGNLLRGVDGRFWLIDWERAAVQPVAADIASVVIWQPQMRRTALDVLRRLDTKDTALSAERLLLLGMAIVLDRRRTRRDLSHEGDARSQRLAASSDWQDGHIVKLMQSLAPALV